MTDAFEKVAEVTLSSSPHRQGSIYFNELWTPACAGVTASRLYDSINDIEIPEQRDPLLIEISTRTSAFRNPICC